MTNVRINLHHSLNFPLSSIFQIKREYILLAFIIDKLFSAENALPKLNLFLKGDNQQSTQLSVKYMIAESTLNIDGAGGAGRARTVSTVQCKTETLNFSHYSQFFHIIETISSWIELLLCIMYNIHQKKIFHYLKKGSMREIQTVMLFESYILYRSGSGILPLNLISRQTKSSHTESISYLLISH